MIALALQRPHEAVDDFRVDAFEDPGVVGVEQADAVRATPRKRTSTKIRSVTHLARKLPNAMRRGNAAALRLADVAAENPRDRRARHPGSLCNFVNGYRH